MAETKNYVAVRAFEPTDDLRLFTEMPLLPLQVGDRVQVLKAEDDWAVGRLQHDVNAEIGMFPFKCIREMAVPADPLELDALSTVDRWSKQNLRRYKISGDKEEYRLGAQLIAKLLDWINKPSERKESATLLIDRGNEHFGVGLTLRMRKDKRPAPHDFDLATTTEFLERRGQKLQHLFEKGPPIKDTPMLSTDGDAPEDRDHSPTTALLLTITSSTRSSEVFELDARLVESSQTPAYPPCRVSSAINGSPVYILLEDFDLHGRHSRSHLRLDTFTSVPTRLPAFLKDADQHALLTAGFTSKFELFDSSTTKFDQQAEIGPKRQHFVRRSSQSKDDKQRVEVHVTGELITWSNEKELNRMMKKRKAACIRLLPFGCAPSRVMMRSNETSLIYLTFSLEDYLIEFKRAVIIADVLDLDGNRLKNAFIGSTADGNIETTDRFRFYSFKWHDPSHPKASELHLEVNLSRNVAPNVLLRLLVFDSWKDGAKNQDICHLGLLPLLRDGVLIGNVAPDMVLYRIKTALLVGQSAYLRLPTLMRNQTVAGKKGKTKSNAPFQADFSLPFHVVSFSDVHPSNEDVLFALNLPEHRDLEEMERVLKLLGEDTSDFSAFILPLVQMLFRVRASSRFHKAVFRFIISIFNKAEAPEAIYLRKVVVPHLLSTPLIRIPVAFAIFIVMAASSEFLSTAAIEEWMRTMRAAPRMVEMILNSVDACEADYLPKQFAALRSKLRTRFHMMARVVYERLRSNNGGVFDGQWMIVKDVLPVFDLLHHHGMMSFKRSTAFIARMVDVIPAADHEAQIAAIRSLFHSRFFEEEARMGFAVGFAPRLVRCLNAGAEQPKKRRRLLVAAITLLTEIILEVKPLIENPEKVQKMRPKFFKLVNCCFGSVIDCHLSGLYSNSEEIAVRSQYLFALFLESIDAQCFAQFLTRLPPTADIHTVLHQTILGLRSMTEPSSKRSFNEPAMRWMFDRLIVKFFRFITALFDDHRTLHFTSIALWKEFLICIHSFLLNTHKEDAFSLFDELNELPRLQAADCLRALWFMIPKSKWASVLGNMLETTIDVLFGGCNQQIRAVLMPLFGQLAFVACADEETGNAGAEVDFYKILYHRLSSRKTKQRKQQVPTLISEMVDEIQELVESGNELYKYNRFCLMPRFIGLVECGKQALMKKHTYQYETVYCELMAFCSSIGEHALSAELNVKFFSFQTDRKHFTEAACGLQNFAKNLSWTAFAPLKQESLFLAKRLALDCTTESELKAELTRKFVALFEREQCWELAVAPLGELADFYANIRPNAKLLAEISEQKRKLERSIETCVRVECHYYLLRFFGLRFPVHLQNREYVMRGLAGELLDNFRQRLIREFGCELIKDAHVNESEWSQRRGKFVQIVAVTPVPGKKHQPLSEVKNPLLSWFYTHNAVQAFDSFRPAMRKETKWTKVAANDSTKFWLQRTRYHLIRELPNVLSFGEVIQRVVGEDLNPVQTATRTIVEANEKLEFLTKMVDCGFKNTHLSALSGHVRGILQAFVGGGIQNYKIFFSPQMREVLDEQERTQVEELKQMLVKQVQLLLVALKTHEKSVGAESRPLHDTLVSSFQGFKAMVEEMCKQDAPATPSSSGQPKAVAKK